MGNYKEGYEQGKFDKEMELLHNGLKLWYCSAYTETGTHIHWFRVAKTFDEVWNDEGDWKGLEKIRCDEVGQYVRHRIILCENGD